MTPRRAAALALAAVLLGGLGGAALVVRTVLFPTTEPAARGDALVVLAGEEATRLPVALGLLHAGAAPVLLVSHPATDASPETDRLCADPEAGVVCFTPSPVDTRGEAGTISSLTRLRGWRGLVVVTSREHVARARLLLGRCTDVPVRFVSAGSPTAQGERRRLAVHEALGLAQAHLRRGC